MRVKVLGYCKRCPVSRRRREEAQTAARRRELRTCRGVTCGHSFWQVHLTTPFYTLGRRTLASDPGTDARPLLPRTTEERAPKSKRQPRARTMIRYDSKYFFRVIFRCVLDGEAAISVTPPRQLIPLSPRALPPRPGSQGGTARCSRTAGRECSSRCSGRRWSPCSRRRSICPSWTGQ